MRGNRQMHGSRDRSWSQAGHSAGTGRTGSEQRRLQVELQRFRMAGSVTDCKKKEKIWWHGVVSFVVMLFLQLLDYCLRCILSLHSTNAVLSVCVCVFV